MNYDNSQMPELVSTSPDLPHNSSVTPSRPHTQRRRQNSRDTAVDAEINNLVNRTTRTRARVSPLSGVRSDDREHAAVQENFFSSIKSYKKLWIFITSLFAVMLLVSVFIVQLPKDRIAENNAQDPSQFMGKYTNKYDVLPPGFDMKTLPLGGLPPGKFTKIGTGKWHILPVKDGKPVSIGPKDGQKYVYTIGVEEGIKDSIITADVNSVSRLVESSLGSPYGWTSPHAEKKVRFVRIDSKQRTPDFRILLTTPETTKKYCGFDIPIESSCYLGSATPGQNMVILNLARYLLGAKTFGGDTMSYRIYEINHEVGHAIGYGHLPCRGNGELAPVMMEQTFSLTNSVIYRFDKSGAVPNNNLTCKPNPWPYPSHT